MLEANLVGLINGTVVAMITLRRSLRKVQRLPHLLDHLEEIALDLVLHAQFLLLTQDNTCRNPVAYSKARLFTTFLPRFHRAQAAPPRATDLDAELLQRAAVAGGCRQIK